MAGRMPAPLVRPGARHNHHFPCALPRVGGELARHVRLPASSFPARTQQASRGAADRRGDFRRVGDLTARKLIPAVYNLSYDNLLPADFYLVGYGRTPIPDEEFRQLAADASRSSPGAS